jgi:uncharacterized protein
MIMSKKTLILGASLNPERTSYTAASKLNKADIEFIPIGIQNGELFGKAIVIGKPVIENLHTITLYLNPKRQIEWYDYILNSGAKRIIFNPGTENDELKKMAENKDIECLYECTLVKLSLGNY